MADFQGPNMSQSWLDEMGAKLDEIIHSEEAGQEYPPLYDLEIVCSGEYKDFPQELNVELEALLPVAKTKHYYIVGMCFVGRNMNDRELDMLQMYADEGDPIISFCCRERGKS